MKHDHDFHRPGDNAPSAVAEVDIKDAYGGSDYASLEVCLCGLPGVTTAHLDRTKGVAHLTYDKAVTQPEKLEEELRRRGYRCDCKERLRSNADVSRSIVLARKVHGKIRQNLFWAAINHLIAIPVAAGALYPSLGVLLRPDWAALLMSASTVTVTLNALTLGRVRLSK